MSPRAGAGLSQTDVLRLFGVKVTAELHVAFPAKVERFDGAAQLVDVKPEMDRNIEAIDGTRVVDRLPVIPSVPIAYPRSKGFAITWPLTTDDTVLVIVADRNLGVWMRARATNPGDVRSHGLDGAIAIPGLYSSADQLSPIPDHLSLRSLAPGGCSVEIRDGEVRVGTDGATHPAAKADELAAHLSAISADLVAIATAASTTAANYGVAGKAALDIAHPISAQKVKIT